MQGALANYYDEEMGTFRSACQPRSEEFDVNSAAMALELFILTDLARAQRAGDFLASSLRIKSGIG